MIGGEDTNDSDSFFGPEDEEDEPSDSEERKPQYSYRQQGNLGRLADQLFVRVPDELKSYRPLVLSLVKEIVPRDFHENALSDAIAYLVEAHRNCNNPKTFSAFAKKTVRGRLINDYHRSRGSASRPEPYEFDPEVLKQRQVQAAAFEKLFLSKLADNQDLVVRMQSAVKDSRRMIEDVRQHIHTAFRVLPTTELTVLSHKLEGVPTKDIAAMLGVSSPRITQIQQEASRRVLEYMTIIIEKGLGELTELAQQSAKRDMIALGVSPLLTARKRIQREERQAKYIRYGSPRRYLIFPWGESILQRDYKQFGSRQQFWYTQARMELDEAYEADPSEVMQDKPYRVFKGRAQKPRSLSAGRLQGLSQEYVEDMEDEVPSWRDSIFTDE